LQVAREIRDKFSQAKALTGLAPYLPEIIPEALQVAREIRDEYIQPVGEVLKVLVPYLPEVLLPEALQITRNIEDEYIRADALSGLVPYLPKVLLPEALQMAREMEFQYCFCIALGRLALFNHSRQQKTGKQAVSERLAYRWRSDS
jgi:hypothetical protein